MGALTRWFRFSLLGIRLGKRVNKRVYEDKKGMNNHLKKMDKRDK
jgi:hypothetical protein